MIILASVGAAIAVVVAAIVWGKLHPILALVLGTAMLMLLTPNEMRQRVADQQFVADRFKSIPLTQQTPQLRREIIAQAPSISTQTVGRQLGEAIAATAGKLALPIVFASIIGACLLHSGAASVVASAVVRAAGENRVPPAMAASSFFLSIPIYFDSVFYLLLPLANAASRHRANQYLLLVLSVVVGGTMAHSLVPPTPGPLLVAEQLSIPVGKMILAGGMLGMVTSSVGLAYAFWISKRIRVTPPDSVDEPTSIHDASVGAGVSANNVETNDEFQSSPATPPIWLALLPIVLPLALLILESVVAPVQTTVDATPTLASSLLRLCGDYAVVLGLSAAISIWLLRRYRPSANLADDGGQSIIGKAISDAGVIVLLTAAGGAFGASLRGAGVGLLLTDALSGQFQQQGIGTSVLPMAFGITVAMRAAQGSATVAMLTAAAILAPVVQNGLAFDPVYLALAIGCGSKPLAWMNDSGFWLVGRLSGMTVGQTLKTFSAALTLMGIAGFAVVWVAASIFPMASP